MDHKVSKDMISSGMIPSGEKTQADLSRTQYGSAPSPSKLMDAYKSMYDKKEEVINEHHKKDADGNTIPHEGEELNEGKLPAGLQAYLDKKKGKKEDKKEVKEGVGVAAKAAFGLVKNILKKQFVKDAARGAAAQFGAQTVSSVMNSGGGQKKQNTAGQASAGSYQAADVDLFDIVKGQLLDEGYSEKEANEIMVNLTEEQLEEFLKQLATRAAEYGANIGKKGSITGFLNRNPNKQSITPKEQGPARPDAKPGDIGFKPSPSQVLQDIKMRRKRQSTIDPKTKIVTNKGQVMQDNADLFDIVKGQLLDEGLSEEEIRDIMLTLTPDEILNEISVGKMANYISAADKDIQKTAASIRKDGSVMGNDPRVKRMSNRGKGIAMAGDKIATKMTPSLVPLPRTEEYKNFDPKKPDPKQMAAQAKQEKNRQKFNDPMGVKNKNIGGQGLDPMDK